MTGKEIGKNIGFVIGNAVAATADGFFLSQPEFSAVDTKRVAAILISLPIVVTFALLARAAGGGIGETIDDTFHVIRNRRGRRR